MKATNKSTKNQFSASQSMAVHQVMGGGRVRRERRGLGVEKGREDGAVTADDAGARCHALAAGLEVLEEAIAG